MNQRNLTFMKRFSSAKLFSTNRFSSTCDLHVVLKLVFDSRHNFSPGDPQRHEEPERKVNDLIFSYPSSSTLYPCQSLDQWVSGSVVVDN